MSALREKKETGKRNYLRKVNWDNAMNLMDKSKKSFISIPMEYEDENRPGIIYYDEKTSYREKMPKEFVHPIVEFFVVYKEKNKIKYELAQIAYDRFKIDPKESILRSENFDGWILKTDWNDALREGVFYKNGKPRQTFNVGGTSNSRVKKCNQVTITYQTVSGTSCGVNCAEITVTLHTVSELVCPNDTPASDYPSNFGNYTSGGGDGSSTTYYYVEQYPIRSYNIHRAACRGGSERSTLNSQIEDAIFATGLAANVTGFSLDKADAIARAVGGSLADYKGLINGVGIAGIVIDTVQLGIGVWDGNFTFEEDGLNAIQLGLGIVGLAAGGWIAVVAGAVTIGISVYSQTTDNQSICQ
ncbi:hypothetical protein [Emticicia sp. TH156]|uniref:hypothetical protein n=1 Tax=Emticicia sp. TH156 TaxID=2067454 RepID=UPI000C75759B|nr:hypothetical protein [Emticicia sp. TH156]PLK42556.1 hypothetical protein C0V77_20225 [Emticicia sp. TH156]